MEFPEGVRVRLYRWSGDYLGDGMRKDLLVVEADDFGRGLSVFANLEMPCTLEDLPGAIADVLGQFAAQPSVVTIHEDMRKRIDAARGDVLMCDWVREALQEKVARSRGEVA